MGNTKVKIEESWQQALQSEFDKPYFGELIQFLKGEKAKRKIIYPPGALIFNAFDTSPLSDLKVVILGQDPYIKPNQAMGLSFSVPKGIRRPPSLGNIYKELHTDLDIPIAEHGDLTAWANQGVFLLNAALTVEAGKSGSHLSKGWEQFTDAVIQLISTEKENIVFMLWGNFAKAKSTLIDASKHLVLKASHPSPLARGAYFGSKHFSQANAYHETKGIGPINWDLN